MPPTTNKAEEPEKKATITIEREKLELMLSRLERLESAANKAGLNRFDEAHREAMGTNVGVKVYEGKRIMSYVMTTNTCEKMPNGSWKEDQNIELSYADGTKEVVPYTVWSKNFKLEQGTVVSKKQLMQAVDRALYGDALYTIDMPNGDQLEIGIKYLNG